MGGTGIYYFSATGNSLAVARELAGELDQASVLPLTRALAGGAAVPFSRCGVVFPVYMFGLPLIVAEFFRRMQCEPGTYLFAVATCGGMVGRALTQAADILRRRQYELASGFTLSMPGNYTPLYGAVSAEKQQALFSGVTARIPQIAASIGRQERGIREEGGFFPGGLLYTLLYRSGSARIPAMDTGFWVTEQCTKCGLCEKVCPVNNISLREGTPAWRHQCEQCMACLQWCPVQAIQYKKNTQGRRRYHHPQITANDIMAQR